MFIFTAIHLVFFCLQPVNTATSHRFRPLRGVSRERYLRFTARNSIRPSRAGNNKRWLYSQAILFVSCCKVISLACIFEYKQEHYNSHVLLLERSQQQNRRKNCYVQNSKDFATQRADITLVIFMNFGSETIYVILPKFENEPGSCTVYFTL